MITEEGRSLLPVGVLDTTGDYTRGDMVTCMTQNNQEVARGLINYNHQEVARIRGMASSDIKSILGYVAEPC